MGRRGRKRWEKWQQENLVRPSTSDDGPIESAKKLIHGPWERTGHGPVEVSRSFEDVALVAASNQWHTGTEPEDRCASQCSWSDKNKSRVNIFLKKSVGNAIKYLIDTVKIEWQLLLIGQCAQASGQETVTVEDFYIPKQEVGSAHVRNLDCVDKEFIQERGVIGTMHSHGTMAAFFSQTDMRDCNSSPILYHVVINNRYEYEAVKQVALPCGMIRFEKASIAFETELTEKPKGFENIARPAQEFYPGFAAGTGRSYELWD